MIEIIPLHLGQMREHFQGAKSPILTEDEVEVGFFIDSPQGYMASLFGTTLTFMSLKREELLEACGLWLAFQELDPNP